MSLEFKIDNEEILINSFNKNFDKTGQTWGSTFKVEGNEALCKIGLAKEFFFKCDSAYYGTYTLQLKSEDGNHPLNSPTNWQQFALFNLLYEAVKSNKAYF